MYVSINRIPENEKAVQDRMTIQSDVEEKP